MSDKRFQTLSAKIHGNEHLRRPQRESYEAIADHFSTGLHEIEVGIVLPVGCGKSGAITLTPFATKASRVLVIAPGVRIAGQLLNDFDVTNEHNFYRKTAVINGSELPEVAELRGSATNFSDLEDADVVVTNIQQLQGDDNKWVAALPQDFFDLILNDEAHHNRAESWNMLRERFPHANIVNFSATPLRADGKLMAGKIIYTFPVADAIAEGFVKHLKAVVLNPRTLRFVRREDGQEVEVPLDEVIRLGESEADFRRSIVSSKESLATIVDASITELRKLRRATGDDRLKIIASALNYEHCAQVKAAYVARGLRADFIHSKEGGDANRRILEKLERHELDVIVQVRMLGEGFDHPYLSVAAVCSVFANLAPFVQFVGRVMRVIKQNAPGDALNQGIVVFHAGSNVARVWSDFRDFSAPDQEYFDKLLLPVEELHFQSGEEIVEVDPDPAYAPRDGIEIKGQSDVSLEAIPLLKDDQQAQEALRLLLERGFTSEHFAEAEKLRRLPISKQKARQANRAALDERVKAATTRILKDRGVSHEGGDLDKKYLGRTNWQVLKAAIDSEVAGRLGRRTGERSEFSADELKLTDEQFSNILDAATKEVFGNG
jgi:superfamily II DNA or RNA helicase